MQHVTESEHWVGFCAGNQARNTKQKNLELEGVDEELNKSQQKPPCKKLIFHQLSENFSKYF